MEDLFYVVKGDFCYDEFDSCGETIKVYRTGEPLIDRQNAINYIKTEIDKNDHFIYRLEFVEEVEPDSFQSLTLIKTDIGGNDDGTWLEKEVSHLYREMDIYEERSLISESNITVIGRYRFIDGIQVLIGDYIENINIRDGLFEAVTKPDLMKIKMTLSKYGRRFLNDVLLKACEVGNLDIAKFCIDRRADINYLDSLPLYHAIYSKNEDLIAYLIFKGANWQRNSEDMLKCAARTGYPWTMKFVIEHSEETGSPSNYTLG